MNLFEYCFYLDCFTKAFNTGAVVFAGDNNFEGTY